MPGEKLGEGGEGVVHRVDGQPGLVLKIWHQGKRPRMPTSKIQHMVANPVAPQPGFTWLITWPRHLVTENGVIVGYTMPILNPTSNGNRLLSTTIAGRPQNTAVAQGRSCALTTAVRMARNQLWVSEPFTRPATSSAT